jgi:cyclopropane fatty-acyl-phospholipid synthase-like methyltransferase
MIDLNNHYSPEEESTCLSRDQYLSMYNTINQLFTPTSIADIGCRVGHLISLFKEKNNIPVFGLDYFLYNKEAAYDNIKEDFLIHDLRTPLNLNPSPYDVIISTEVGEHIEKEYSNIYLDSIKKFMGKDSNLIMTWSPQGGHQHFNPLSRDSFFSHMENNGFILNIPLTTKLVETAKSYNVQNPFYWYFTGNLSVWNI